VYSKDCASLCAHDSKNLFWRGKQKTDVSGLGFPLNSELTGGLGKTGQDTSLHLHCLTQIRSEISGLSRMNHTEVPNNITESLTRRGRRGFHIWNAKGTPEKQGRWSHWDNSCGSLAEISLTTRPAFLVR